MLFEKILELLAALAVAVAGIVGINTAAGHADPPANDAALNGAAAKAATIKPASGLSRHEVASTDHASLGPTDGLARTLDALTRAAENAPEQADQGLDQAIQALTELTANDAPAGAVAPVTGPPAETPVGPPLEPPVAPPVETPVGPPAELPGGRP